MLTWMLLLACTTEITETTISGPITDAQDGRPVVGAQVTVRDSQGERFSTVTTDGDGNFETTMPVDQYVFIEAEAEAFVPTAFTVLAGQDPLTVQSGQLWMKRADDRDALEAEFSACQGEGNLIEGEVRLYVAPQQEWDTLPKVTTAQVTAYTEDGTPYFGCYLDDEGESVPDLERTGYTGRFAIFGVPSGRISIKANYSHGEPQEQEDWYEVYVPEAGVVPFYPLLVSLP